MSAYYNEIDPYAAHWLRNLIAAGHIADGIVDERSIVDVQPSDLAGFTQCHFFAGIGVWSHALRLAGWADDRPVWTGSCPCQPFSVAGARRGSEDERHLWPAWFRLIRECRPPVVFGEQAAGASGLAWLDHVLADLEDCDYAAAAANLCAAGAGAPHIRQRLYFVAESTRAELPQRDGGTDWRAAADAERLRAPRDMADAARGRIVPRGGSSDGVAQGGRHATEDSQWKSGDRGDIRHHADDGSSSGPSVVANADGSGREGARLHVPIGRSHEAVPDAAGAGCAGDMGDACGDGSQGRERPGNAELHGGEGPPRPIAAPGATNGFWADAEWIWCHDGKWRATKPGVFPLAHGTPGRVGRLRAYGNAIVAPIAAEFIAAAMTDAALAGRE